MVLTGLKLGAGTLIARYGREPARRLFKASISALDAVERLVEEEHIDCHFRRCGHLALASKPAHCRHFEQEAQLLSREFAHEVRTVPRAGLRDDIGSDFFHGGLLDPASACINPARYVAGLARAARGAGASVHEMTPVQCIERDSRRWRLRLSDRAVDAGDVLVATSGYTGAVTQALCRKIVPVGSYIIATEPLPDHLALALIPRNRMLYDSRHFLHYFRLTADRRLLFGGRARFVPETGRAVLQSAKVLRKDMLEVFPQLQAVRIDYAWGGNLDFAFDTMPHAGQLEGFHFALGYAGHGVALATHLGTLVGEELGRDAACATPFASIPFPGAPLGLYSGQPWFLPMVAAWYKILDWVG
jgi:glycine/D-amino acid oxidase-like deaminating enzyme